MQTPTHSKLLQSAEHQHTHMTPAGKAIMQAAASWPTVSVKPSQLRPWPFLPMPSRSATGHKSAATWLLPVPTPCPWARLQKSGPCTSPSAAPPTPYLALEPAALYAVCHNSSRADILGQQTLGCSIPHLCHGPRPVPCPGRAPVPAPPPGPSCRWCQQCGPHPALAAWPAPACSTPRFSCLA